MSLKINRKTTEESLTENLEKDGKLLAEVSTLFTFAAVAMSGEPVSLAVGIALILKTAGSALSAGTNIVRRLTGRKEEPTQLAPYDRFRILFYITCQQCFIEALVEAINQAEELKQPKTEKVEPKPAEVKELTNQLKLRLQNLDEAEVTYLFCVEPLSGEVALYDAFEKWSISLLSFYGYLPHLAIQIGQKSRQEARKRFHVYLAGKDDGAEWMRNYLALTQQQETSSRLVSDLAAIRETLANWTDPSEALKQHQKQAWDSYRKTLTQLPDQKETMFNEQFGVRKVFVQPHVFYHVQGAEGDAGQAQSVPDLGRLLGALISSRLSGEDLVILCGGPGSGKSTLCRIMASELASDPAIHPVFLRLRRAKEGAEIGQYIEDSLQKLGLASRLADLREIPNLILILDGFDELVMASRARLRHFFNVLREDLSSGPLRNAKAIVSGRDTLFPRGEGLPNGSQVLSLQPFDKLRVRAWGTKWRLLHKKGPGGTFHPEQFIEKEQGKERKPPLQHLVSWPLTLHLVARVHTAGKLEVGTRAAKRVEKAYLYRSILAETSHRQSDQTEGVGRLDERKMRDFLRELAWEMHSHSVDSMDPADVMPVLKNFYPEKPEQDLAELAEVAVVNCPELTKGEQTGFEFVHKSFAEFLVAERFADLIEKVAFKSPDYGSDELTWRMSEQEAARELAPVFSIRLIPEEVQEMLEPMLGCFGPFGKGERVDDVVAAGSRKDGLTRIVDRFETLYSEFLRGGPLETVAKVTNVTSLIRSSLEAYANYCAGLLIIGTAASRQLRQFNGKRPTHRLFSAEPSKGSFWRCLCILAAGGLIVDDSLAIRLLDGVGLVATGGSSLVSDTDSPMKLGLLGRAEGYDPNIPKLLERCLRYTAELEQILVVMQILPEVLRRGSQKQDIGLRDMRDYQFHRRLNPVGELTDVLVSSGLVTEDIRGLLQELEMDYRKMSDRIMYEAREGRDMSDFLRHLVGRLERLDRPIVNREYLYWFEDFLRGEYLNEIPGKRKRRSELA
jgi:hypothetical protein